MHAPIKHNNRLKELMNHSSFALPISPFHQLSYNGEKFFVANNGKKEAPI
jgi:hypothetical protein